MAMPLSNEIEPAFLDRSPVLVAADSSQGFDRAVRAIEAAGLRVADLVSIADAPARIDRQIRASALWVEIDQDGGDPMDRLLDQVDQEARSGRFPAIVSTRADVLDPVAARLGDLAVDVLVDSSDSDRVAALAVLLSGAHKATRLSDVASDQSTARLRQLSDEVGRIAATLARLSAGGEAAPAAPVATTKLDVPEVSADTVRAVIRARRLRSRYFDADLFADPAWDMLLDLLQAEIAQLRVPVSSLCIAAAVPATTALRWLKTMTQSGIFVRRADPHDGRRVFVELSRDASIAMRRYFAEVGPSVAA
jgi:DNA-binding MarR family transcriptional regulator